MSRPSPTLEGFRAALRMPSITFAEITWRWTVGAVACTLVFFSFVEYLNTLPVTRGDRALLATRQPLLIGRAFSHILRGSLNRAVYTTLIALSALAILWVAAASLGRITTLRSILNYFDTVRSGVAHEVSDPLLQTSVTEDSVCTLKSASRPSLQFAALLVLNFLRLAAVLAALLAFVGAAILVSFASPAAHPHPGLPFFLFLPCAAAILVAWEVLSWFLSLGSLFAVRDSSDTLSSLSAAVTFSRHRLGSLLAVSTWTSLAHLVALSIAATAASFPLAFLQIVPPRIIFMLVLLVALVYFAVADWLFIARLAAYTFILVTPEAVLEDPLPMPSLSPIVETSIDRDEPILSDLPNFAAET